jgi:glyoxylase-like metal-dependent hydrolase (beta-lactamase superfamily II)
MDGRRGATGAARLSCHCILLEGSHGLVLLDTGLGVRDVTRPRSRLSPLFLDVLCRPRLREEDTAVRQIERLGFSADDVRDIVLTHLDFDHAGGLDDFPKARVHLFAREELQASAQRSWLERQRFRPAQWSTRSRWVTYSPSDGGEAWLGLEAVRPIPSAPYVALIPLPGHTLGHAGIAFRDDYRGWMLLAGDAYFFHGEVDPRRYHCPPGLRFYQWLMETRRDLRLANQVRLRELVRAYSSEVTVFCSHDETEFDVLSSFERPAEEPPSPWVPEPVQPSP